MDKNIRFNPTANELQFLTNGSTGYYQAIKIENRLARILHVLLNNANEVISRNYFVEVIWEGNANVGNPALTKSVSSLRGVFKKHQPGSEHLIETIPKIGYRLKLEKKIKAPSRQNGFWPTPPMAINIKGSHIALIMVFLFFVLKLILNGSLHGIGHQMGH